MSKFAFCIITHNEPEIFKGLVRQIDHKDNNIYVMVDRKSDISKFNYVQTKYSNIYFCPNRIDIRWGGISQVKAEITLFRFASSFGDHMFYHLLSGQDLLIKPVSALNDFIKKNSYHEFLGFRDLQDGKETIKFRLKYYHFFPHFTRSNSIMLRLLYKFFIKIQQIIGIRRHFSSSTQMGANWASISQMFVNIILNNEKKILKRFRYTLCCDEIYKQVIAIENGLIEKCDELTTTGPDQLRIIDWERGRPYTWKIEDYDLLKSSGKFIARKFNSEEWELIHKLLVETAN